MDSVSFSASKDLLVRPDYKNQVLVISKDAYYSSPTNLTWTAIQDGYVWAEICCSSGSATTRINLAINGVWVYHEVTQTAPSSFTRCASTGIYPVKKGDAVIFQPTTADTAGCYLYFVPLK